MYLSQKNTANTATGTELDLKKNIKLKIIFNTLILILLTNLRKTEKIYRVFY